VNERKWIFVHSGHLFHFKSLQMLLHPIQGIHHSCLIHIQQLFHMIFCSCRHLFQSNFLFLHGDYFIVFWLLSHFPLAALSYNVPFLPAFISMEDLDQFLFSPNMTSEMVHLSLNIVGNIKIVYLDDTTDGQSR
jgi:hypothetical protein